jgi:hypothetical protein
MNDNLRYISLQYIKGDNYEKITCFHSEDIKIIKEILKLPYIKENYEILEKILKKDKHEIGESLLDDLINYISFKDLKGSIEEEIKKKEDLLKNEKDYKIKANKDSSDKLKELTDLIKDLENKIKKVEDDDTASTMTHQMVILFNLITKTFEKIIIRYNIDIDNCKKEQSIDTNQLKQLINDEINIYDKDYIKIYICKCIDDFKKTQLDASLSKSTAIKFAKKVISFLKILENLETEIKKSEKDANNSSINDLEKLIKIFLKYLYICENNIKKYERIFDYNEIGSIDDAFMIESYSKFLKKLHKLKQNLETKDTKKIKRELINSLDQFFNLHGFNSPDKIDNEAEINYIVQRILNYT